MSDVVKQVKVDNWGIYFLQRLKHFFNRTDYCDLTLQFQDNAQLKVHRLVLNACTEYFELLERTCEMYEDCLVMPDDLQADVVVPIINFMYTGQLEFRLDSLEKLYQTSLVMNMPVLTKLLEAHRNMQSKSSSHNYSGMKNMVKSNDLLKSKLSSNTSSLGKRTFNKAFESFKPSQRNTEISKPIVANKSSDVTKSKLQNTSKIIPRDKKYSTTKSKPETAGKKYKGSYRPPSPIPLDTELYSKKFVFGEPRPTRYELPEELDTDNIFENSFTKLSYTSKPLMVHPDASNRFSKRLNLFMAASSSKKGMKSTVDIVECKKVSKNDSLFDDDSMIAASQDEEMFQSAYLSVREESNKDPNQLFDQILDSNEGPKVTIEGKDKQTGNLDHAKIISEVLKKYPHLVKGNKNIKLKILNTSSSSSREAKTKKTQPEIKNEINPNRVECTYETDVLDSKEAAKLIAMGAENIKGPWICLICGTPGRALNFTSYYNFRRHLVEVHNEKPVSSICEYCGLRSYKRNYLLHHIYTKHGVPPPPQYHFPKCNMCDYVALTEAFLIKHKLNHSDSKTVRCEVCSVGFSTTNQLHMHIEKTGHHYNKDRKPNLQCVYCMKIFLRENNFYVHLKTSHREMAIRDGIIEESDDERQVEVKPKVMHDVRSDIKYEQSFENEYEDSDIHYPLQQKADGNIKKSVMPTANAKRKILNPGFNSYAAKSPVKPKVATTTIHSEYSQEVYSHSPHANEENIVLIDGDEYIMKENQLIPKKSSGNQEYILSDLVDNEVDGKLPTLEASLTPTTSMEFENIDNIEKGIQQSKMVMKKAPSLNQPIQIVVSNEEEYKALMSSNHSIIFDDGDTGKTLTVLTAPHTNSIDNTALELQNAHSGDMMIIQQDYPLNVTEAVSAVPADSKYVVVYSHEVGHENQKQYQIITPQEIGAEFVQASEVITQNYETVTTTTSVLDTHVIETQMEEQWSEQTTDVIEHDTETDKIEQTMEQTLIDPNTSIEELPEVELAVAADGLVQDDVVASEQIPQNMMQANTMDISDIQNNRNQVIVEEIQNHASKAMDVDVPSGQETNQTITEEVPQNDENVQQNDEHVQQNDVIVQQNDVNVQQNDVNVQQDDVNVQQDDVNIQQDHLLIQTSSQPSQDVQEVVKGTQDNVQESTNIIEETEKLANNIITAEPKVSEQIKNIASEWSDDDTEMVTENPPEAKALAIGTEGQLIEESEVEESIENIQQEMEKQLSSTDEVPVTEELVTKETTTASQNPQDSCNQNDVPSDNATTTKVKLTSLLNEWEDNDSQEEEDSSVNKNENDPESAIVEGHEMQTTNGNNDGIIPTDNNNKTEENETNISEFKKDDNIKRLVSDWDDEEEELKE